MIVLERFFTWIRQIHNTLVLFDPKLPWLLQSKHARMPCTIHTDFQVNTRTHTHRKKFLSLCSVGRAWRLALKTCLEIHHPFVLLGKQNGCNAKNVGYMHVWQRIPWKLANSTLLLDVRGWSQIILNTGLLMPSFGKFCDVERLLPPCWAMPTGQVWWAKGFCGRVNDRTPDFFQNVFHASKIAHQDSHFGGRPWPPTRMGQICTNWINHVFNHFGTNDGEFWRNLRHVRHRVPALPAIFNRQAGSKLQTKFVWILWGHSWPVQKEVLVEVGMGQTSGMSGNAK